MYILKLEFNELTSLYAKQHFWLVSDNSALIILFSIKDSRKKHKEKHEEKYEEKTFIYLIRYNY